MHSFTCFYCGHVFPNYLMRSIEIYSYLIGPNDWVMEEIATCGQCDDSDFEEGEGE